MSELASQRSYSGLIVMYSLTFEEGGESLGGWKDG